MTQASRNNRKELTGVVISNKMEKTVTVRVSYKVRHPRYKKVIERSNKYYAHDESNSLENGQQVRIMQTRPLSKLKCWRVVEAH